jgi:hypothetical protein
MIYGAVSIDLATVLAIEQSLVSFSHQDDEHSASRNTGFFISNNVQLEPKEF